MRFFSNNRKAFSTIEYIVIFFAITTAVVATTRLVKGSWNFKIDSMERGLHNSFYDHMKPGPIDLQDCECTDWINVGCAKSICGPCDKLSYRGCRPMGCSPDGDPDGENTQKCIPSADDPNTPEDESCPGESNEGCGTDQPTGSDYEGLCPWGTHVQVDSDCANPIEDPACDDCPPTYEEEISCIGDTDCEFECGGINFDINGDGQDDGIYIPCPGSPNQAPTPTTPSTVIDLCPPDPDVCVFTCANLAGDFDLVAKGGACVCEETEPDDLEFDLATMSCICPPITECELNPIPGSYDDYSGYCAWIFEGSGLCIDSLFCVVATGPNGVECAWNGVTSCDDFPSSGCPGGPCTENETGPGVCIPVGGSGPGGSCTAIPAFPEDPYNCTLISDTGLCAEVVGCSPGDGGNTDDCGGGGYCASLSDNFCDTNLQNGGEVIDCRELVPGTGQNGVPAQYRCADWGVFLCTYESNDVCDGNTSNGEVWGFCFPITCSGGFICNQQQVETCHDLENINLPGIPGGLCDYDL